MHDLKSLPASLLEPGLWVEVPTEASGGWGWRLLRSLVHRAEESYLEGEGWTWSCPSDHLLLTSSKGPLPVAPRVTVPGWDSYFLTIAGAVALRAKCRRRQVGAVVVSEENRILATGYNGFPAGVADCLEGACPRGVSTPSLVAPDSSYEMPGTVGYCPSLHAEVNALAHARTDARGSTIYITDKPCPGCQKHLAAAGVVLAVWPQGSLVPLDLYRQSH